jgi:quercetin dioxygenase-like cupin family protein
MITEQQQESASLYALGALPPEERRAFEELLRSNSEVRELVQSLQRAADLMALGGPSYSPPPQLKEKLIRRIQGSVADSHVRQTEKSPTQKRPGFHFHGAGDPAGWKKLPLEGAWIKLLSLEADQRYAVVMGRLGPGVRYPAHKHFGAEELYILSGDLHVGDRSLGPGDFHHSDAGTAHDVNYSVEGCTLLAVLPVDHELVKFAMA